MKNTRGLNLITVSVAAAIVISTIAGSAFATGKMDAEIHDVVIGKLEAALKRGGSVQLEPVRSRLADLYADRARLRSMDEAERNCQKCTGALSDRRKALQLYTVVLRETSKANRGSIMLQMAQLHELNGESKAAESYFDRIVREGRAQHSKEILAEGYIGRAEARFGRGESLNARKDFEAALKLVGAGRKGPVMQRIAWAHLNLGEQERAVRTLVQILETPALLERESSQGVKFDPSFQDDIARDLAIFLARGDVSRRDVVLVESLTPDRSKREVLTRMAKECERLGQKRAAIDAWSFALKYENNHEDRIEAMVRMAQIRFDLGRKQEAFDSLKSALDLWTTNGCTGENCAHLQARVRSLIASWHRQEKQKPSALLAQTYLLYIAKFPDDVEMTLWAAEISRVQKNYAQAATLYYKTANLAAESKAKNARRWLQTALVGEIEMAELSKNKATREAAYDHYIALNPNGSMAAKVRYMRAHVAYERGDMNEASSRFWQFVSSPSCRGKLTAETEGLCLKAADLDLDALVAQKAHAAVQMRATEYARLLPARRAEYLRISRTAVLKQAEILEPGLALAKLNEADTRSATVDERVRILKMRIAIAEKAQNLKEVRGASEALLALKGISESDREFALGRISWSAEMSLDFGTAYLVTKRMKLKELKPDARALKLVIFAELAGKNPRPHIDEFLKVSKDSYQKALMRAKLVRLAKASAVELKKQEKYLKQYPGLYASLALEIYSATGDLKFAERSLKVRGVKSEPEGRILAREILIREYVALDSSVAKHKIHTGSDRLVNKTLAERLKLVAKADQFANRAIGSRDWTSQILALSVVARENRRLHGDLLRLPIPAALKGKDRRAYALSIETNAKGYLAKAEQVEKKIQLLWGQGDEQKALVADYRAARKEVRPVLARELRRLIAVAPQAVRTDIEEEMRWDISTPSEQQIIAARREARENPFNVGSLRKLREIEVVRGRETMVAYLDARLMKLQSGVRQ